MKKFKILSLVFLLIILLVGIATAFRYKGKSPAFIELDYIAGLGPIGTNPPQLLPYDVRVYSMKTDYFAPSTSTDSLIGFNINTRQYTHYAKPVIPTNISAFTNDSGYLTGITNGQVIGALGFTPYNSTNPNGYISSITSGQINTALGYTPYNGTTNPNGYLNSITSAQIISALGYTPAQAITLTAGTNIGINQSGNNYTINNTYNPSINETPNRVIGTNFTPSTTRPVIGIYRITCSATNPLIAGASSATITAEYSTNGGTTWNPIMINGNSNSVGLAVTIQLTNAQSGNLVVPIKANYLVRLRSTVTGTAVVSIAEQIEMTF